MKSILTFSLFLFAFNLGSAQINQYTELSWPSLLTSDPCEDVIKINHCRNIKILLESKVEMYTKVVKEMREVIQILIGWYNNDVGVTKDQAELFKLVMSSIDVYNNDDENSWVKRLEYYEFERMPELTTGNPTNIAVLFTKDNREYVFPFVPRSLFTAWKNAESKGEFYHLYIAKYSIFNDIPAECNCD